MLRHISLLYFIYNSYHHLKLSHPVICLPIPPPGLSLACSPLYTQCQQQCLAHRGGGGGLVAQSCPTLATSCTVVRQAPLSMGFTRQEYWNVLTCSPPEDLLDTGLNPHLLCLLHWQVGSLPLAPGACIQLLGTCLYKYNHNNIK